MTYITNNKKRIKTSQGKDDIINLITQMLLFSFLFFFFLGSVDEKVYEKV
jgi:hypothetical protein